MKNYIIVPRQVVIEALGKARRLYIEAAPADAGPADECWAEFERLAEYVEDGEAPE